MSAHKKACISFYSAYQNAICIPTFTEIPQSNNFITICLDGLLKAKISKMQMKNVVSTEIREKQRQQQQQHFKRNEQKKNAQYSKENTRNLTLK